MINITFPDKSVKKYESSINGLELAKSISNSLAKSAVCIEINGELKDLSYLIEEDSVCKIFTKDDQYSLDTVRPFHQCLCLQPLYFKYRGLKICFNLFNSIFILHILLVILRTYIYS